MISAKIIADSVNPYGNRITTFVITYPRFILAEVNTHRALSRNSASSRAIPIKTMLRNIWKQPAEPVSWGQNCKGMQAKGELPKHRQVLARIIWLAACYFSCLFSWLLNKIGVHKQLANRVTEPWAHMTTIVTATEWGNFFNLRCHKDAQPEFQELAFQMLECYVRSKPHRLDWGQWHLPFAELAGRLTQEQMLKVSVARCARVSYLNFEGKIDHEKDFQLCDSLIQSGHCSPLEHAAMADPAEKGQGNFHGWLQYRKTLPNENRVAFDAHKLLASRC